MLAIDDLVSRYDSWNSIAGKSEMMRSLVNSSTLSNGLRLHRKLLMKSSCCSKPGLNGTYLLPRLFSGSSSQSDDTAKVTNFGGSFPDFNSDGKSEGFEQLTFPDAVQPDNVAHVDKTLSAVLDAIPTEAADIAVAVTTELGNHPTHLIMRLIENIHLAADLPYWQTIVVTTIALRIILFPMAIYTIQNASRMPHAKPKIQKLQDEFTNHPDMATDPNLQVEFRRKMTQLLQRENVNPVRGILSPLCQIPIFLSMFFGLKEIGNFLPGMTTGGVLWFTDLTATDAFMIFPVLNALSFLLMIEIGMDGLPPNPDMDRFKIVSTAHTTSYYSILNNIFFVIRIQVRLPRVSFYSVFVVYTRQDTARYDNRYFFICCCYQQQQI